VVAICSSKFFLSCAGSMVIKYNIVYGYLGASPFGGVGPFSINK